MRSRFKTALVTLVAVFALGALVASAASADILSQEFLNNKKAEVVKKNFTGESGVVTWTWGLTSFKCKKESSKGNISGTAKLVKVVMTFGECEGREGTKSCAIRSPGAKQGEIVTKELKGELGEVVKTQATSEVGLLLEPENAEKEFTKLEGEGSCIPTTRVTGRIAGEVTPVGVLSKTDILTFKTSGGKQNIKEIERSEGDTKVKPQLTAFGVGSTWETSGKNTFEEEIEVTKGE